MGRRADLPGRRARPLPRRTLHRPPGGLHRRELHAARARRGPRDRCARDLARAGTRALAAQTWTRAPRQLSAPGRLGALRELFLRLLPEAPRLLEVLAQHRAASLRDSEAPDVLVRHERPLTVALD